MAGAKAVRLIHYHCLGKFYWMLVKTEKGRKPVMKIRSLAGMLGGSACVVLFASFAIAQGGELVHAEYGFEGRRVDVTAQVRAFVREGMLQMEVSNQTLGVDPAPQRTKELVIQIHHWDGDTQAYVFREGTVVNLELDPPRGYERQERGLHIIR